MINRSLKNNKLFLKCFYLSPYLSRKKEIQSEWENKVVDLSEITLDRITNKCFVFNYDSKRVKLLYEKKIDSIGNIYNDILNRLIESAKNEESNYLFRIVLSMKKQLNRVHLIQMN